MNDNFEDTEDSPTLLVSDKLYDRLRFLAVILLPALGAAYFGLAQVWGLPASEQVVGTIVVVDTLLGVLIRAMRKKYETSEARFDGAIVVEPSPEDGFTNLNVSLDPVAVQDKDEVLVKVKRV